MGDSLLRPPFAGPQNGITAHRMTTCRCANRMADMSAGALLTIRSKSICGSSLLKPLRILLPRTRFLRHRIKVVSSSLGLGPSVRRLSSSLAQNPYFRFGFGPIIRLQLRLEPLFLLCHPLAVAPFLDNLSLCKLHG